MRNDKLQPTVENLTFDRSKECAFILIVFKAKCMSRFGSEKIKFYSDSLHFLTEIRNKGLG